MSTKVSTDLIDLSSNTGGLVWAKGTTAEQPASATAGEMRVDTTTATTVVYTGTQWKTLKETAFVVPPVPTHFLVVAGGGASSEYVGGGGGAGGLRTSYGSTSGGGKTPAESTTDISLNIPYTITVGEGGVGGTVSRAQSLNGGNSTFSTITSIGGGGSGIGGGDSGSVALVGGSGGGGGSSSAAGVGAGAAGTANEGYAGGSSGFTSPNYPSAGGGGASAVGVTPASAAAGGGNGGSGLEVNIIGGTGNYYAGGGGGSSIPGGGSGGIGGGGTGATYTGSGAATLGGTSGVINTGGGAGGGSSVVTGGASGSIGGSGGSGVVILRYPTADLPYFTTTGTLNTPSATDTVADVAYPVTNLAYYKLDSNANDSSGNGYNGTASNITYGNGRFNEAANFNGSSSYVTLSDSITTQMGNNNFSFSFWVYFNTLTQYDTPIAFQKNYRYLVDTATAGVVSFYDGTSLSTPSSTIATGNWYNIVVTKSSTAGRKIYVNGSVAASDSSNTNAINEASSSGKNLIGAYNSSGTYYYHLDGSIDQVRIFSSVLAAGDVEDLYNEHFPTKFTDGSDTALKFTGGTGDITFADTAPVFTPGDNFNTVLYTGTGSGSKSVTGVGFQPDLVWGKSRNDTISHILFDVVRGENKQLSSNTTGAEVTRASAAYEFDSDGFTVTTAGNLNNAVNYVAWNWKAGGAARSNTKGTLTSTISANVDAGFSIVKYTGNNSSSATIGHGLGKMPAMVMTKMSEQSGGASSTSQWMIYHKDLTGNVSGDNPYNLYFSTNAELDLTAFGAYDNITTDVIPVTRTSASTAHNNNNLSTYVAYCFAEIAGYSKIGSYTGNGSTTGPIVTLGFEPAWIMIKRSSSNASGGNWIIKDNKRDTTNPNTQNLYANLNALEENAYPVDFNSNNFQILESNVDINENGGTYIYMAFATNPT